VSEETQGDAIQIRVEQTSQLFSMLDPFPFRERDLDAEAEEYIVSWARELPRDEPIRIIVHMPAAQAATPDARGIGDAFAHFFGYRAEIVARDLNELFRVGRRSLVIGLVVLGVCLVAGQTIAGKLGPGHFGRFLEEGLIILGWVANWRPIEIFLYEWWPLARKRDLYRGLAEAAVIVMAEPELGSRRAP
jgi:hypothetical protein